MATTDTVAVMLKNCLYLKSPQIPNRVMARVIYTAAMAPCIGVVVNTGEKQW
jgi:hypothetical protein